MKNSLITTLLIGTIYSSGAQARVEPHVLPEALFMSTHLQFFDSVGLATTGKLISLKNILDSTHPSKNFVQQEDISQDSLIQGDDSFAFSSEGTSDPANVKVLTKSERPDSSMGEVKSIGSSKPIGTNAQKDDAKYSPSNPSASVRRGTISNMDSTDLPATKSRSAKNSESKIEGLDVHNSSRKVNKVNAFAASKMSQNSTSEPISAGVKEDDGAGLSSIPRTKSKASGRSTVVSAGHTSRYLANPSANEKNVENLTSIKAPKDKLNTENTAISEVGKLQPTKSVKEHAATLAQLQPSMATKLRNEQLDQTNESAISQVTHFAPPPPPAPPTALFGKESAKKPLTNNRASAGKSLPNNKPSNPEGLEEAIKKRASKVNNLDLVNKLEKFNNKSYDRSLFSFDKQADEDVQKFWSKQKRSPEEAAKEADSKISLARLRKAPTDEQQQIEVQSKASEAQPEVIEVKTQEPELQPKIPEVQPEAIEVKKQEAEAQPQDLKIALQEIIANKGPQVNLEDRKKEVLYELKEHKEFFKYGEELTAIEDMLQTGADKFISWVEGQIAKARDYKEASEFDEDDLSYEEHSYETGAFLQIAREKLEAMEIEAAQPAASTTTTSTPNSGLKKVLDKANKARSLFEAIHAFRKPDTEEKESKNEENLEQQIIVSTSSSTNQKEAEIETQQQFITPPPPPPPLLFNTTSSKKEMAGEDIIAEPKDHSIPTQKVEIEEETTAEAYVPSTYKKPETYDETEKLIGEALHKRRAVLSDDDISDDEDDDWEF